MSKTMFRILFASMITIIVTYSSCTEEEPEPEPPVADFTYETDELKVTFTNASVNATTYSWDFGDMNMSEEVDPEHTYELEGTYEVKLIASNESNSEEKTMSIEVAYIPKKGAFVVNEGNFGSGNGSISFYDEELMTITNNVVKETNGGSEIGSLVQSIFVHNGIGYIICNGSDKIEFINARDYTYLANPITNISQPRSMAVVGDKGYVTCWGPWDFDTWTLPGSYVAVMDLNTKSVVDTVSCGSGPEGIFAIDNTIYVANSYETSITVINTSDNSTETIPLSASPKYFAQDGSGMLWASTSTGLLSFDPTSLEKSDSVEVLNINGKIAIDGEGEEIFVLTAEPWPGTATEVHQFNTISKTLGASSLISGENFYGLGFNPESNKLYLGDSKAFAGPGELFVYDVEGTLLDKEITSIGPNGFAFK